MNDNADSPAARSDRPKVVIERSYRARVDELWDLWTTKCERRSRPAAF